MPALSPVGGVSGSRSSRTSTIQGNLVGVDATVTYTIGNGVGIFWLLAPARPDRRRRRQRGQRHRRQPRRRVLRTVLGLPGQLRRHQPDADGEPRQPRQRRLDGHERTAVPGVLGGFGPGEGNVIAHNGLGGPFSYPAGFLSPAPAARSRLAATSSTTTGPSPSRSGSIRPRGGSRRRGRRAQREAERSRADRHRLRASDGRALPPEQHAVDDLRRGLLRQHELRVVSRLVAAGRGERRLDPGHDQRPGVVAIDFTLPSPLAPGGRVAAIATDPAGNTSEFSQTILLKTVPRSGPAGGRRQRHAVRTALPGGGHRIGRRARGFERRRHPALHDHGEHAGVRRGDRP